MIPQYINNILLAGNFQEECLELTISLLNFFALSGYPVSEEKAQIAQEIVTYLGFEILKGQRQLSNARKETICQCSEPQSVHELEAFLGIEMNSGNSGMNCWSYPRAPFIGPMKHRISLKEPGWKPQLQDYLILEKTFKFFTYERQAVALSVFTQHLGEYKQAVAYFSKQLDLVCQWWPECLKAVAAIVLLI